MDKRFWCDHLTKHRHFGHEHPNRNAKTKKKIVYESIIVYLYVDLGRIGFFFQDFNPILGC